MKNHARCRLLIMASLIAGPLLIGPVTRAASDDARVTRVVRDVKLLPAEAKPKPASVDDKVSDGTGVRTGDESRSELTFVDLTIERLGANTVFSFDHGGRSVRLNNGSMLLRVPKDSGGASMSTTAVTVGVTGTTVILQSKTGGRNKLTVLEGGARVSLNKYKGESVYVHGGQMEDVPAGATKLPPPVNVNISDIMRKNPLITDFPPLPSQDLIMATASNPPPVYQGQPVGGGPGPGPGPGSIVPTIGGIPLGPIPGGGNPGRPVYTGPNTHVNNPGNNPNPKGGKPVVVNNKHQPGRKGAANPAGVANPKGRYAKPTPTPSKKNKNQRNLGNP